MNVHVFRLHPGQDLKRELEAFVNQHRIEAGWVMTCVGSLSTANIRFADKKTGTISNGPFEIISLVGTVSRNGCHLHVGVSDGNGRTIGGHLLEGNLVHTTAEIVLGESTSLAFDRVPDKLTGWRELTVTAKDTSTHE